MNLTNKEAEPLNSGITGIRASLHMAGINIKDDNAVQGGFEVSPKNIDFLRWSARQAQVLIDAMKVIEDRWDRE